MSESAERERLERKLGLRRARFEQALKERRRLKWFLVLAATTWPVGLLAGPWYAAWIFVTWLLFWAVGRYSNYFHVKQARTSLKDAEDELAQLTLPEPPHEPLPESA